MSLLEGEGRRGDTPTHKIGVYSPCLPPTYGNGSVWDVVRPDLSVKHRGGKIPIKASDELLKWRKTKLFTSLNWESAQLIETSYVLSPYLGREFL